MDPAPLERWPALRRTQHSFLDDLAGRRSRGDDEREQAFRTPPRGTLRGRWHVCACGYVTRIAEALGADYAAVERILGAEAFRALVLRYLAAHPPQSHDLAHAGDRLPEHLEEDPLGVDLPFLADLARLERQAARAFIAAEAPLLTWAALQAMPKDALAETPLVLHPSVAWVRSQWPLLDLWAARRVGDEEIDIALEGRPCIALVYRDGFRVRCEPVDELVAAILGGLAGGTATLGELPLLALRQAGPGLAVRTLVETFRALVEKGLFVQPGGVGTTAPASIEEEA